MARIKSVNDVKENEKAIYGILHVYPSGFASRTPPLYATKEKAMNIISMMKLYSPIEGHTYHPVAFVE